MKKEQRKPKQLRVEKTKLKELTEEELKITSGGNATPTISAHLDAQAN